MKASIKLEYDDKTYQSDFTEVSQEELEALDELVCNAVSGQMNYLSFKAGKVRYYFGEEVVKESVISIVTK